MDRLTTHKDLIVWHKAITLASKVYAATRLLPSEEQFGLNQQLRRCSVAIASTIAEGAARRTRVEFTQFLHTARGALSELETQLMIAKEQQLMTDAGELLAGAAELGRLIGELIRNLGSARQAAHAKACAQHPTVAERRS
jgi:four helix bundle protein